MIGLNQEQKDFVLAEVQVNKESGEDNPYHVGAGSFFILRGMNDEHKGKGTLIMEDVNDYLFMVQATVEIVKKNRKYLSRNRSSYTLFKRT